MAKDIERVQVADGLFVVSSFGSPPDREYLRAQAASFVNEARRGTGESHQAPKSKAGGKRKRSLTAKRGAKARQAQNLATTGKASRKASPRKSAEKATTATTARL